MTDNCRICDIYEKRLSYTRMYDETSRVIIVQSFNSQGSKNPRLMAVLKRHTDCPTEEEKQTVEATLKMVADKLGKPYAIEPEKYVEHYHRHATF